MASRKVPQNAQQVGPAKDASSPNKTRKKSSGKAQAEADDSPKTPTQVKRTSPRKSEAPPVSLQSTQQKRPAPTSSEPDQRVTKKRNVSESLGDTQAALHGFQVLMEMYQVKDECLETSEKQRVKAMSICEAQGKAIVEKDKKIEQLQLAAVNARAYCEEIEEENEHFQNEMHQLQREKDCLQDEKEQKTTILTICNKRLAELRAKNKEIEEANEELGKEVRDYRDLVAEYEQKLAKHEIAYDAVTNDEIHRLWWQLHNIMYSMVIALFNVDPTPNAFPDCKHRDSVIQLAKDCVDHSSLRPLVLQQFIWSRLLEDVFCGGVGVWGGELGQHLVGMTKEFAGMYRIFAQEILHPPNSMQLKTSAPLTLPMDRLSAMPNTDVFTSSAIFSRLRKKPSGRLLTTSRRS